MRGVEELGGCMWNGDNKTARKSDEGELGEVVGSESRRR